jgi:hypothetical protein
MMKIENIMQRIKIILKIKKKEKEIAVLKCYLVLCLDDFICEKKIVELYN